MSPAIESKIETLRANISRSEKHGRERDPSMLLSDVSSVDDYLVASELSSDALHEFFAEPHPSHKAAMIARVCGLLAHLPGPLSWCLRRNDLFAPGLAAFGLATTRVHLAEVADETIRLLLIKKGRRHTGLASVVGVDLHFGDFDWYMHGFFA